MTRAEYHQKYYQELMEDNLPFWMNHAIDAENGGVFNSLTREGKVYCTDKSVWLQGRCAWIFSYLCGHYEVKEEWKAIAESCLKFLTEHCIDPADGRMYFSVTADGRPLRKRRYFFSETFYIIACAEYASVFGDAFYLAQARKYYDFVLGIYQDPSSDPYKITPKTVPGTRDTKAFAPAMILLNVSHIMARCDKENASRYMEVATALSEEICRDFVKPDMKVLLEVTGPNGEFLPDATGCRTMNPGHAIEGAWFLFMQAKQTGDKALIKTVENIFRWSVEIGWDKEYGGLRSFVDVLGYPPEALEHDMKLWWPNCELIICSLMLYNETGDEYYWDWFVKADAYATEHFRDPEFGEWYGYLNREGKPTLPACKGCGFKGVFHVPRMLMFAEELLREE